MTCHPCVVSVLAAVGRSLDADAARALGACGLTLGQLEASVRGGGGAVRGGRMMIERAPAEVVPLIAHALGVDVPPLAEQMIAAAKQHDVPLIVGWDAPSRQLKVYINASDAAGSVRASIARALDWGAGDPHLFALNVGARIERKVYVQSADAVESARMFSREAETLVARAEGICGGAVTSFDVSDSGKKTPRAFFVAVRGGDGEALLAGMADAIDAALPFARGVCRSVGVAPDGHWTAYFKPRDCGDAVWDLDPAAIYASGDAEVGIFVAPQSVRAFVRTAHHAISYRVRCGSPSRDEVTSLMAWAIERVRACEEASTKPVLGDAAPPPWRRLG